MHSAGPSKVPGYVALQYLSHSITSRQYGRAGAAAGDASASRAPKPIASATAAENAALPRLERFIVDLP
jgi:hypothetical protein